jgi:hypothetical protein
MFGRPLYFLDKHIYQVGYTPAPSTRIVLSDKPVGWVLLITILVLSVVLCISWTLIDRRRKNYQKLDFWFRIYLAYYLFVSMDFYAIFKINLVQMPFPNAAALLSSFGQSSKINLLFNTIGVSPLYSILTGVFEMIAAVLLLNRRTRVLGSLLMMAALINIVSLNLSYNVDVKLLSILMLIIDAYLLSPYLIDVVKFLCFSAAKPLSEKQFVFTISRKHRLLQLILVLVPLWVTFDLIIRSNHVKNIVKVQKQVYYQVSTFIKDNDTLPPLLTDTLRIKNLLFTSFYARKYAVIYTMKDSDVYYNYSWDQKQQRIHLMSLDKGRSVVDFSYKTLPQQKIQLTGVYKSQRVTMLCKEISLDNLPISQEKFTWVERK